MPINTNYKYEPIIDFNAPIIPGIGLGNISFNQPLSAFKDWVVFNFFNQNIDDLRVEVFNGIFVNYCVANKVEIIINLFDSKIEKLGCKLGYEGSFNGIRPGSKIFDLIYSDINVHIENSVIIFKDYPGIEIDIPSYQEDVEDVNELSDYIIERIYLTPIRLSI